MLSTILPTAGELVDLGFGSDAKPKYIKDQNQNNNLQIQYDFLYI